MPKRKPMAVWKQKLLAEHLERRLTDEVLEEVWRKDPDPGSVAKEWSERDFAFFCRYYLPHYFNLPLAPMHWELGGDIEQMMEGVEGQAEVITWPRGFGKSTTVCVGLILWCICWEKKHYVILIKDSFDQAKLELRSVKGELENNEEITEDFGSLQGTKWDAGQIVTSNDVMIEVLGMGMKIRGRRHGQYRPDLIIVDDPESLDTVDSPTQRSKSKRKFHRSVMKAGGPGMDIFAIGTKLHTDCLIASLIKTPVFRAREYRAIYEEAERQDLWEQWKKLYVNRADPDRQLNARAFFEAREAEMLRGSRVGWPEGFPYYRLQVLRLGEEDEAGGVEVHSFEAEMQNNPIAEGQRLFAVIGFYHIEHRIEQGAPETWLVPDHFGDPVLLSECELYGACDPSLGESERSDFSAIVDLLVGITGQKFVGRADIERRLPDEIIRAILEHVRYWRLRGLEYANFGIESVGFQKLLKTDTAKGLMREREYLPLEEVPAAGKKYARIASLQPDFKNEYMLLLREMGESLPQEQRRLYDQLRDYPSVAYDDGPDALEMVNRVAALGEGQSFDEYLEDEYGGEDEPESPEDLMERLAGKGIGVRL